MRSFPDFPCDKLSVIAWPDTYLDLRGHDPRSRYVEVYWLGILGPSATWLVRHFADELEASPSGFVMDILETASLLGVGGNGRNSAFVRALGRLVTFDIAEHRSSGLLAVHRRLPSLSRKLLTRLPPALQSRHEYWQKQRVANLS